MSDRDSEDEYFRRLDHEAKARLKARLDEEARAKAVAERTQLHHNHCGKCGGALSPKPFRGVEIDVCGECGAVLLDPGELETLAGEDQTGVLRGLLSAFGGRR